MHSTMTHLPNPPPIARSPRAVLLRVSDRVSDRETRPMTSGPTSGGTRLARRPSLVRSTALETARTRTDPVGDERGCVSRRQRT